MTKNTRSKDSLPTTSLSSQGNATVASLPIDLPPQGHQHGVKALRCQNQMLPISQLPVETFQQIFMYLVPGRESAILGRRQRLAFTYVCHAWRTIALNDPLLWTRPLFDNHQLAQEMIKRASSAPLYIDLKNVLFTNETSNLLGEIVEKCDIRWWDATLDHMEWVNIRKSMARKQCFPYLEHLNTNVYLNRRQTSQPLPILYQDHAQILAPRVQSIHLTNTPFPLQPQPLHNLTYLDLSNFNANALDVSLPTRPGVGLSPMALVQLLGSAPRLEEAHLRNAMVATMPISETFPTPVPLLHLRSLLISSSVALVHDLLQCIHAPNLDTLTVQCISGDSSVGSIGLGTLGISRIDNILQSISRFITESSASDPGVSTLQTWTPSMLLEEEKLWLYATFHRHNSELLHNISLSIQLNPLEKHSVISHARDRLPLEKASDFIVLGRGRGEQNQWKIFASLSWHTCLTARGDWSAKELIRALSAGQSTGLTSSETTFPRVSSIVFQEVKVDDAFLKELGVIIISRSRLGVITSKLAFVSCKIASEPSLQRFKELIPETLVECSTNN